MGARHIVAFLAIAALAGGAWPMPGAAESSTPDFLELTDPAGDVDMQPAAEPAPTGLADLVDLRAFRLDQEDGYGWRISWHVAALHHGSSPTKSDLGTFGFYVRARVGSDYILEALVTGPVQGDLAAGRVAVNSFSVEGCLGPSIEVTCYRARQEVTARVEANQISLTVDKAYFRPKIDGDTPGLRPGTTVEAFQVRSWLRDSWGHLYYTDQMASHGATYALRVRAINRDVMLMVGEAEGSGSGFGGHAPGASVEGQAVPIGGNATLSMTVTNRQAEDRLIFLGFEPGNPAWFRLGGPAAVWVPGGQDRIVPFWVDTAAAAEDRQRGTGNITAVIGADPGAFAKVVVRFEATPPLDPEVAVLWFHSDRERSTPRWSPLRRAPECCSDEPFHILAWPQTAPVGQVGAYQGQFQVLAASVFAQPALLDVGNRTVGTFTVVSNAEFPGVRWNLQGEKVAGNPDHGTNIFAAHTQTDLHPGSNEVSFSAPVLDVSHPGMARGDAINLLVDVTIPIQANAPDLFLKMDGASFVQVPLKPDPLDLDLTVSGPFRVALGGMTEHLVNPGEWHEMVVEVWNLDAQARDVTLSHHVAAEGWEAWLRPGASYRIPAGQSIRVSTMVRAPLEAQEGDEAAWTFALDGGPVHVERVIRLTVVTKADLRNPVTREHNDPAAQAALLTPDGGPGTPGLSAATVAFLVAFAAAARRRRPT